MNVLSLGFLFGGVEGVLLFVWVLSSLFEIFLWIEGSGTEWFFFSRGLEVVVRLFL